MSCFNVGGGNCCWIIILILILFCGCGNGCGGSFLVGDPSHVFLHPFLV